MIGSLHGDGELSGKVMDALTGRRVRVTDRAGETYVGTVVHLSVTGGFYKLLIERTDGQLMVELFGDYSCSIKTMAE